MMTLCIHIPVEKIHSSMPIFRFGFLKINCIEIIFPTFTAVAPRSDDVLIKNGCQAKRNTDRFMHYKNRVWSSSTQTRDGERKLERWFFLLSNNREKWYNPTTRRKSVGGEASTEYWLGMVKCMRQQEAELLVVTKRFHCRKHHWVTYPRRTKGAIECKQVVKF
jgi:hypothetical protein